MHIKSIKKIHPCLWCEYEADGVVGISDAPVHLGVAKENEPEHFFDMDIYKCRKCNLIFKIGDAPSSTYQKIHSSAVGKKWSDYREWLINKLNNRKYNRILEIGPSINPIARSLEFDRVDYIDCMQSPPFKLFGEENYYCGLFPDFYLNEKYDLIIASHVFEHSKKPREFIERINKLLQKDGKAVITFPYFEKWINNGYYNAFTSEHEIYPIIGNTDKFEQHSALWEFSKKDDILSTTFERSGGIIENWLYIINSYMYNVNLFKLCKDRTFYICGASHLAQYTYLMMDQNMRNNNKFVCLDNDVNKHKMKLYGTNIMVEGFDLIKDKKSAIVIVPPSPYRKEMTEQILCINEKALII